MTSVAAQTLSRLLLLAGTMLAVTAEAYPWMIKHGYTSCQACHVDPSGATLLTPYGKAQSDILLRTHYGKKSESEEPTASASTALSAILPDWLNVGASVRLGYLNARESSPVEPGATISDSRFLLMQTELRGAVNIGAFRSYVSLGVANVDPKTAAIFPVTPSSQGFLISREHWVGVAVGDAVLIRAGRMDLPFGLRNNEHNSFVRSYTRTDINGTQQHGAALSYNGERWRGELMAIAGNYQLSPDDYRERGYSAFAEYRLAEKAAVGVSSLATEAALDLFLQKSTVRQAHGVFGRYSPTSGLTLLVELDSLLQSAFPYQNKLGYVGWFQPDWEILQGLHLMPALEIVNDRSASRGTSWGSWISSAWYLAPQSELRIDYTYRRLASAGLPSTVQSLLFQVHFFL